MGEHGVSQHRCGVTAQRSRETGGRSRPLPGGWSRKEQGEATTKLLSIRLARCAMSLVFLPLSSISSQSPSSSACVTTLPASAFLRVPVLVDTNPEDMAAVRILPAAELLAQSVAERIRNTLGSETGALPTADSAVKWSELGGSVVVVAHRDGSYTWDEDTTALVGFLGTSELHRIADALDESMAAGDRIFW